MSTPISLDYLNQLRARLGKTPLKSWKESKVKLAEAIGKCGAQINASKPAPTLTSGPTVVAKGAYKDEREAILKTGHSTSGIAKRPKPAKTVRQQDRSDAGKSMPTGQATSAASQAAAQLGMNPKNVRAKLRKLGHNAGHGLSVSEIIALFK